MLYAGFIALLVNIIGCGYLLSNNQTLAVICFCSSIVMLVVRDLHKETQTKIENIEKKIKIIVASVDRIFANDQFYTSKELTPEEIQNFIEGLTQEQFNKLADFIGNFPSFFVKAEGTCPKCGKAHTVRYTDFVRFFQ